MAAVLMKVLTPTAMTSTYETCAMQPQTTPELGTEDTAPTPPLSPAELAAAERRKAEYPGSLFDRRRANAAEKRRTSERRRLIDPTTCERDYTDEETAFMKAMECYKRENRRPFPTWSEVLEVLASLGYRKVAEETELPGTKRPDGGEERRVNDIPVTEDRRNKETPPKG